VRGHLSGSWRNFVRCLSGDFAQPDKRLPFANNNLDPICRKCRVFLGGREGWRIELSWGARLTDLNDARA
jgi:hypothetical protein